MELLELVSGFCWTIVYLELIYLGFKENTYGMPFVALAFNFSWEFIYSFIGLENNFFSIQTWFIILWLVLDLIIVFTYLIFGKNYFPKHCNKSFFIPWTILIFLMAFVIQYFFLVEFKDLGKVYSAFIGNLVMSMLFINMFVNRSDLKGQSLIIAINKWIGTLAPTILFGVIYGNTLILALGIFCSIFDIIYIYFLNDIKDFKTKEYERKYQSNRK